MVVDLIICSQREKPQGYLNLRHLCDLGVTFARGLAEVT